MFIDLFLLIGTQNHFFNYKVNIKKIYLLKNI